MKDLSMLQTNSQNHSCCDSGGVIGEVRVSNQFGLHARPAAQLVKLAQQYNCSIKLKTANGEANAKSILDILGLAAGPGVKVHIHADGPDEKEALQSVVQFFSNEHKS